MGLDRYADKRDFRRTPEPPGKVRRSESGRLYLIQKHAARNLHYDLRLELNGVLKSWAVPKGPSLDPGEKRLAVHVEDHPIDYGSFEGIIPEGEYGAGTVLLWDRGVWEPEGDPEREYRRGRLHFRLRGEKLQGAWTLARMGGKRGENDNWLLIKRDDEEARPGETESFLDQNDRSVATGRSLVEISAARDRQWRDGRAVAAPVPDPSRLPGARPAGQPELLSPQLARLVTDVPTGDDWVHEIKLDGYRILCFLREGRVRLISRRGLDWTGRFGPIAAAVPSLSVSQAILDGEIVVLNRQGISDFQALQNVLQGLGEGQMVYYAFDLLHCEGYDLTRTPLVERKGLLKSLLGGFDPESFPIRYSDHIQGEGNRVFRHACRHGLEGIVSKRAQGSYLQSRSGAWLKIKCLLRQEFVIGGFSDPSGARTGFGALLVGYQDGGKLIFAGRVGTGFDAQSLRLLESELRRREVKSPPFSDPPRGSAARGVHWVRPEMVAEIEFTEWTEDGRLRHPSFKGLREDRDPQEVRRERPEQPSSRGEGGGKKQRSHAEPPSETPSAESPAAVAGVVLSNPERILFPEQGVTKASLARYYENVAGRILPFVTGRPLTVVRCPQGRGKKCFYQKHLNESVPAPVRGVSVLEKEEERLYLVIDDLRGLITLVQLGALEFHPWGSREDRLDRPDMVIFDLDPGPDVPWKDVIEGARLLHQRLEELDLEGFVKTSGGKGLHVVVPLVRRSDWEEAKMFTRALAEDLDRRHPGRFVTTMAKARRQGRIFIDFFRNSRGATSVAPYSTRARPGAPISTPLGWDELSTTVGAESFHIDNLPGRLAALESDPWKGFFDCRQSLTKSIRRELGF